MLECPNVLIFEDPTNHLDLESITSLNEGMNNYKGNILFSSHDHELLETVSNRIIKLKDYNIALSEAKYDVADISDYINKGKNTVVFNYPMSENGHKAIRLFVELVEKDDRDNIWE